MYSYPATTLDRNRLQVQRFNAYLEHFLIIEFYSFYDIIKCLYCEIQYFRLSKIVKLESDLVTPSKNASAHLFFLSIIQLPLCSVIEHSDCYCTHNRMTDARFRQHVRFFIILLNIEFERFGSHN